MARKKKVQHAKKMTISLAVIAGLAPTPIMAYKGYTNARTRKNIAGAIQETAGNTVMRWIGYNPDLAEWHFDQMKYNLLPAVVGIGIHKLASKAGINRMIAAAGIPMVRV
jgi:uncharacterized membrane protein YebE (DUF533 family)